jgi:hypothetical protein
MSFGTVEKYIATAAKLKLHPIERLYFKWLVPFLPCLFPDNEHIIDG